MAAYEITARDRDLITRAVATEVDHRLAKTSPREYQRQVSGVIDTVINRAASGQFSNTIEDVLNEDNQFSAINGPTGRGYEVYGSVSKIPDSRVPDGLSGVVNGWIDARMDGAPSSVGGGLHYANPLYSDAKNREWIDKLDGPTYGTGKSVHHHGTTEGYTPYEAVITGERATTAPVPGNKSARVLIAQLSTAPGLGGDYNPNGDYSPSGVKLPPMNIPQVGTQLDTAPPRGKAPSAASSAAAANRMFDADAPASPAPPAKATAAAANRMFDTDPAASPAQGGPVPASVDAREAARTRLASQVTVTNPRASAIGLAPTAAMVEHFTQPQNAAQTAARDRAMEPSKKASDQPGLGGAIKVAGGIAGTVQMPAGARPAVLETMMPKTEAAPARMDAIETAPKWADLNAFSKTAGDVPKYLTETVKVPVASRADAIEKMPAFGELDAFKGKPKADEPRYITKTTQTLNPEWVKTQQVQQPVAAPPQRPMVEVRVPVGPAPRVAQPAAQQPGLGLQTPAYGAVIGRANNGGIVTQGRNGPLNSTTQKSEAWRNATGLNGFQGGGSRDNTPQSIG